MATLPFSGGYTPGDDALPITRPPGDAPLAPYPTNTVGRPRPHLPIVPLVVVLGILYAFEHARYNRRR